MPASSKLDIIRQDLLIRALLLKGVKVTGDHSFQPLRPVQ